MTRIKINSKALLLLSIILCLRLTDGDNIRLPDQISNNVPLPHVNNVQFQQQQQSGEIFGEGRSTSSGQRQGKHLLDFVGLGTGSNVDPYLAQINSNCLSGELADCFKSQALGTFNDFFAKESYSLSESARIVRMPETQLRSLHNEPYEFVSESRATDSDWDQLVKFAMRKIEKFLKSTAFEVEVPENLSEGGRYSPRFIDAITDEIDVLEDKKAPLFSRNRLKKLFIPLLIILKLFKLKLLLFLPLILGLASFKKFLGFMALIVPGVIGYFKLCRPQNNFGAQNTGGYYQYNPQGLGTANYHSHYASGPSPYYKSQQGASTYADPYSNYYRESNPQSDIDGGSVRFGEDGGHSAQNLAYQGYSEYRNNNKSV